jgi:hypothetical protein
MRFSDAPSARVPVVVDGDTYYKSDWMDGRVGLSDSGSTPAAQQGQERVALAPSVYLVEQSPGVSLRTHFHRNNQFQLIVQGNGWIGPHPVSAVTVHYAGAYSGYGPLLAGPQSLAYFTLRTVYETGSLTMKDHASAMRRGPKRQLTSQAVPVLEPAALQGLERSRSEDLIAPQADGIAARLMTRMAGEAIMPDPAMSGSVGQFLVVLAGTVVLPDRTLGIWDSAFIGSHERTPSFAAGHGGAQVVCLHMPPRDPAYD